MKKIISTILVCVLLLGCVFTLASCSKTVSGTYEGKIDIGLASYAVTYTFSGKKVTAVSKLTVGVVVSEEAKGTYEITENEDGTMEITFDFEEEKTVFKDGSVTFAEGEDYIQLAGVKYTKAEK